MLYTYFFRIISILAVFSVGCSSIPDKVSSASWLSSATSKLDIGWSQDVGDKFIDINSPIKPVITEKHIFTLDQAGLLHKLVKDTGEVIWKKELEQNDYTAIAGTDKYLLVTNAEGSLTSLNLQDATVIWQRKLPSAILSQPTIADTQLVVQLDSEKLQVMQALDGMLLWSYFSGNTPFVTLRGTSVPYVEDEYLYTGFANGDFIVLSLATGDLLWQKNLVSSSKSVQNNINDIDGSFHVSTEHIFVDTHKNNLMALDKKTGNKIWQATVSSEFAPVESASFIYIVAHDGGLYCLDKLTGQIVWVQAAFAGSDVKVSAPVLIYNYLVIADNTGNIYLLSQEDGKFIHYLSLSDGFFGNSLTVEANKILAISRDATLYSIDIL